MIALFNPKSGATSELGATSKLGATKTMKLTLVKNTPAYQTISITLDETDWTSPTILTQIKLDFILDLTKGVVIEGLAPSWLHAHLATRWHVSNWFAIDDTNNGAIVIKSHNPSVRVGSYVQT